MFLVIVHLHVLSVLAVSFQIHCGGVQSQNDDFVSLSKHIMKLAVYMYIQYILNTKE